MQNLRSFVLEMGGINAQPWCEMRHHINAYPISAKTLFNNDAMTWDVVAMELNSAGYISEDEELLFILRDPETLKRSPDQYDDMDPDYGSVPSDWTEEDFIVNGLMDDPNS